MAIKDDIKPLSMSDDVLSQFTAEEQYLLRPMKSVAINMEAVVRFHKNQQDNQLKKNPFVSWTLNKIAVIDRSWLTQYPDKVQDGDFWRVKVEHETSAGQPVGCFVVRPLWKVERKDLVILAPSTWTKVQHGLTVVLYPKIRPWMPWIIPKALRQMVMRKTGGAALVIPLSYPPEGEPKNSMRQDSIHKESEYDTLEQKDAVGPTISDPEVVYKNQRFSDEEL